MKKINILEISFTPGEEWDFIYWVDERIISLKENISMYPNIGKLVRRNIKLRKFLFW